jgi:3-deoxy-manno-octulosonate cytidylyltransferase (CMP-KDO synthetase)
LNSKADVENPNHVKVITDLENNAVYFSRSVIPFLREGGAEMEHYKHIGIYAFRKQALLDFYHSEATPLELAEKIECLRYLEQGKKIRMITTYQSSIGIDTPDDLEKARIEWQRRNY